MYISSNANGTLINIYHDSNHENVGELWNLTVPRDNANLIAVRYKNQYFRNTKPELLSATPSDVLNGKTFIGYDGTLQTGTMTIEETTEQSTE